MMSDCQPRRDPGLACSRMVGRRYDEAAHAKNMPRNTSASRTHPTASQLLRRTMPNTVSTVRNVMVPTTPKNAPGKNRNGPQRHIFGFGAGPAMMPPVLGNKDMSSRSPSNEAPATRNHRTLCLFSSMRASRPTFAVRQGGASASSTPQNGEPALACTALVGPIHLEPPSVERSQARYRVRKAMTP